MKRINIDEALKLLSLDAATISEKKLTAAYRAAAKRFHPDSHKTYKAKTAAAESFMAATDARNLLLELLRFGELPRKETTVSSAGRPRGAEEEKVQAAGESKNEKKRGGKGTWSANPFIYSERGFYDNVPKPPFQWMLHHKWIGPIFMWPFGAGLFAAVLACGAVFAALAIPGAVVAFILFLVLGEDRVTLLKTKGLALLDYAWGLPMFPVYYLASAAGAYVWTERYGLEVYLTAISLCWFALSCMVLDEMYSLLRYHLFLKKRASRALAVLQKP